MRSISTVVAHVIPNNLSRKISITFRFVIYSLNLQLVQWKSDIRSLRPFLVYTKIRSKVITKSIEFALALTMWTDFSNVNF